MRDLGIAIINVLEQIHNAGYIYNDLKLDNILVDLNQSLPLKQSSNKSVFENCKLRLIDFGFATSYIDKETGKHMRKTEVDTFRGNMIFASLNQLEFYATSRRDDLISLCYMLVYSLNRGKISGIDLNDKLSRNESFHKAKKVKETHHLSDLCCNNAKPLKKFVVEIF